MFDLKKVRVEITNYKCFGDEAGGYSQIMPINLIIGRNNSGKSSLLDLIDYVTAPKDITSFGHQGLTPRVILSVELTEEKLRATFSQGHDDIGRPLWHTGERLIGKSIFWEQLPKDTKFISIESPLVTTDLFSSLKSRAMNARDIPFTGYSFRRLVADRDIVPEHNNTDFLKNPESLLKSNGQGATNAIRSFLLKSSLAPELIEKALLNDLNRIFEPDSYFTRIETKQLEDERWEIYLEEKGKGRVPLSRSGSGLKTVLLVLVYLHLVPAIEKRDVSEYLFGFEELENNLHPALQRRLLSYLRQIAVEKRCHFFLTTHSSVAIDLFSSDDQAQILHVAHNGQQASVRTIKTYIENCGVLDDLDIRASDLLQANGIVWVEGPTDRMYFNHWVSEWSNGQLKEGTHYQCVFYGGRLLAHLTAADPDGDLDKLVKIFRVNRNAVLLMDSDKKVAKDEINRTKQRLIEEITGMGGIGWVTAGREIENYIPKQALSAYLQNDDLVPLKRFADISTYLEKFEKDAGKRFERGKGAFAEKIIPYIKRDNLAGTYDLKDRLNEVCKAIRKWNGLSE